MKTLSENIPDELKNLQRWVGCDHQVAELLGVTAKTPLSVFQLLPANISNSNTWGTFDQAQECLDQGIYDHIGFVFADDGIVGIDIDDAFDDEGLPTETALRVIHACHSYTEISKSGKGFHILCKGELPFSGGKGINGVEIYKEKRFFVLTGRTVIYNTIENAQEGIQMVINNYFENERDSGLGNEFKRLWKPFCEVSDGKMIIRYPKVDKGYRHLSMVSYCGQIHSAGAAGSTIVKCALEANKQYLQPPLEKPEVISIVKSIMKYRR